MKDSETIYWQAIVVKDSNIEEQWLCETQKVFDIAIQEVNDKKHKFKSDFLVRNHAYRAESDNFVEVYGLCGGHSHE